MDQQVCSEAFSLKERLHRPFTCKYVTPWLWRVHIPSISLSWRTELSQVFSQPQYSLCSPMLRLKPQTSLPGEDRLKFRYLFLKDTLGPTSRSICRKPENKGFGFPETVQQSWNLSPSDPLQTLAALLQKVRRMEGKRNSHERGEMTKARNPRS